MNPEAYKNSEPKKVSWACPCNGCKKAQKVIIDQIVEEYRLCDNVGESENKLFCYTWWRHNDCERLRELLYKITKNDLYTLPEIRPEVAKGIDKMINDPDTQKLMERLKYMEENGI